MAGAELLGLLGEIDAGDGRQFTADEFGPVADDGDDPFDACLNEGVGDEADHGPPRDGDEHLGKLRLHARPFPGG